LRSILEVPGSVTFDEHRVAIVEARTGGIVERAYPLAVGDFVRAGVPLVDVRVPEWFAAESEYLALKDVPSLAAAAKNRLLQLGMSAAQVAELARRGKPRAIVTLSAPRAGMLSEFTPRQGMTIAPGQVLARINGIERVWIEAYAPEAEATRLGVGDKVEARLAALPGKTRAGVIAALIPELQRDTRTLRARVTLENTDGLLKPGMSAFLRFSTRARADALLVPAEAVIATGKRHIVIAAPAEGRFVPVEVTPGVEAEGKVEILAGALIAGERIVVSGQFMMDSEASLRGVLARMQTETTAGTPLPALLHVGVGVIQSVANDEIVLAHDPVPELGWPSMTMPFSLSEPGLAQGMLSGQRARFYFRVTEDVPVIERLEALPQETRETHGTHEKTSGETPGGEKSPSAGQFQGGES
jgi:Cu(I)/Ag(I) efflux system membrane fusion protein